MYFLSVDEQDYLVRGVRRDARRQPVADELRGWSWPEPPLKPIYEAPLGMHEVAGKYCPTGRDVYLRRVMGENGLPNSQMRAGRAFHGVVADVLTRAKRLVYQHGSACIPHVARLVDTADSDEITALIVEPGFAGQVEVLRAYEVRRLVERLESVLASQPHVGADALTHLGIPVSVELKLDGRTLGLSQHLSVDAVNFSAGMVLDAKFGPREPFHRFTTTGYALALESRYDVPIDIGCVVYVMFVEGRIVIERDLHIIGDELRQVFLDEREEKMRMVSEEIDPGYPPECRRDCPYLGTCHPVAQPRRRAPNRPVSANLPA